MQNREALGVSVLSLGSHNICVYSVQIKNEWMNSYPASF